MDQLILFKMYIHNALTRGKYISSFVHNDALCFLAQFCLCCVVDKEAVISGVWSNNPIASIEEKTERLIASAFWYYTIIFWSRVEMLARPNCPCTLFMHVLLVCSQKRNIMLNPTQKTFLHNFCLCMHHSQPSNLSPRIDLLITTNLTPQAPTKRYLKPWYPFMCSFLNSIFFKIYFIFIDFVKLYWLWCEFIVD